MDKIEKFIAKNRELFDNENVPDTVWEKIQLPEAKKQVRKKVIIKPLYKFGIAASLTGIIFLSVYLFMQKTNHARNNDNNNIENNLSANNEDTPKTDVDNDLPEDDIKNIAPKHASEINNIYKSVILKQNELKNVASANPELYKQFASDLAILDSSYRVLESQAVSSPNHDVIIKAMIQNLQLQAELLSRQLSIINQFKNQKNEHHETNNESSI